MNVPEPSVDFARRWPERILIVLLWIAMVITALFGVSYTVVGLALLYGVTYLLSAVLWAASAVFIDRRPRSSIGWSLAATSVVIILAHGLFQFLRSPQFGNVTTQAGLPAGVWITSILGVLVAVSLAAGLLSARLSSAVGQVP